MANKTAIIAYWLSLQGYTAVGSSLIKTSDAASAKTLDIIAVIVISLVIHVFLAIIRKKLFAMTSYYCDFVQIAEKFAVAPF